MNLAALLTSAGINIAVCVVLLSLYSILRKQPCNFSVYFARRLAQKGPIHNDPNLLNRFVPSASWLMRAWEATEDELLSIGGVDAVVFLRIIVFSLRLFSVATFVSMFLVLPFNYYGQEREHTSITLESLQVFTIENVKTGSRWLWGHCLALHIITLSTWIFLYLEYKNITNIRLTHLRTSPPKPSQFTVLVRSIPWHPGCSYSDTVKKFFTEYHGSNYLGHQMVYRCGKLEKMLRAADKMISVSQTCTPNLFQCGTPPPNAFRVLSREDSSRRPDYHDMGIITSNKEVAAAFIFFKSRYTANVAAELLQSANPMLWVTNLAPEPHDVCWSNLCIPYRQLWIRKLTIILASVVFMFVFIIPVTFVQGLTQLDRLDRTFFKRHLKKEYMHRLVTGYLPSVILMLFLYTVPPMMMLFAAIEGNSSRSGRKKSACHKVLVFMIWNVFFVNVISGSVIVRLNVLNNPSKIPTLLGKAVPAQASFFTTYVLTSGWASLSSELMQPTALIWNGIMVFIFNKKDDLGDGALSFPYHTEVPRVLLFGFLGLNFSILSPLILPLLLVYFFYAFLVYRNQFLNVYVTKYESGGKLWPTAHKTMIVSLVLMQVIGLGVFGLKGSTIAIGFTIPLIIGTILFHEYCRQRFNPIFKFNAAEILIELDRKDEQSGKMKEIHRQLKTVYRQLALSSSDLCKSSCRGSESSHFGRRGEDGESIESPTKRPPRMFLGESWSFKAQCNAPIHDRIPK